MFVISLASVSCLLVSGVLSLVLQLPQSTDGQLGDISRHFNFTTMLTSPTSPSNSSMNAREILCDKIFGSHMRPRSCLDALQYVPETPAQLSFGERGTGRPDIGLPYRFLSSDGLCQIDILLPKPTTWAYATTIELKLAAAIIIRECVGTGPMNGGIAPHVGKDQKLAVVVAAYKPKARCDGPEGPSPTSCQVLLNQMPASHDEKIFGYSSFPGVGVELPQKIVSRDGKCAINIDTTGSSDVTTWYRIWESSVAIVAMCARHGSRGIESRLGDKNHLFVEIYNPGNARA